ncbi:MAG: hypothetical protein ACR2M8_06300 [Pyrinomonadaceae bacterium]|nr:hypothetical protein [Blastocatellia bacterium]MDQ3221708.1 hypothetical protein [Acidobacteriota bacterium]MDQ3491298.1 hypothetical protein [Acidobacteriota bacterium]
MYRRPKFLEVLIEIRQEMAREADYDVDFFSEMVRSGQLTRRKKMHSLPDTPLEPDLDESPRKGAV